MISFVLPTRDRPERLKATLLALDQLGPLPGGGEVIVVDNASSERLVLPLRLASGVRVREIALPRNEGAAARNHGAAASDPASQWIVMLDDDSYPDHTRFLDALSRQPQDVLAVSADIHLSTRGDRPAQRESGGLPEVFIGCGVAVRREAFRALGGYDPAFNYYAEEYDLAARMILAGGRIAFEPEFRVTHAKDARGRNMDLILSRLVRNNGWVAQRYAPEHARLPELRETRSRYRRIAAKERALAGFTAGLLELRRTVRAQIRTPMSQAQWDRFTGLAAARAALHAAWSERRFTTAALVEQGKNAWVVGRALIELGVRVLPEGEDAEVTVIGTMSPGPMLDAFARRQRARYPGAPRVLMPWIPRPVAAAPVIESRPPARIGHAA